MIVDVEEEEEEEEKEEEKMEDGGGSGSGSGSGSDSESNGCEMHNKNGRHGNDGGADDGGDCIVEKTSENYCCYIAYGKFVGGKNKMKWKQRWNNQNLK